MFVVELDVHTMTTFYGVVVMLFMIPQAAAPTAPPVLHPRPGARVWRTVHVRWARIWTGHCARGARVTARRRLGARR